MPSRAHFLDQLRTLLIALVILHHAAITYAKESCCWFLQQHSAGPWLSALLKLMLSFNQSFFMGMFFLISGYFVPASLEKKGVRMFLMDRLRRLGIPLLVTWLVLSPLTKALAAVSKGTSFAEAIVQNLAPDQFQPESGVLWFVMALMLFSTGYVVWQQLSGYRFKRDPERPLPRTAVLAGLIALAASSSLVVASIAPLGEPIPATEVLNRLGLGYWAGNLSYLPPYITFFAIGCAAAQGRWLERISTRQAKTWGVVGLVSTTILVLISALQLNGEQVGISWINGYRSTIYLLISPFIACGVIVWLLWWFRTHNIPYGTQLADASADTYGAYILHPPVLVTGALLLQSVSWPVPINLILLFLGGTIASFGVSHILRRLPISRGIL